ncbi:MAG: hypothetical protein PVH99_17050, partial [Desulfobacteraceae bacterium]
FMYASFLKISDASVPRAGFRKAQLAYGHFPSASQKLVFRQSHIALQDKLLYAAVIPAKEAVSQWEKTVIPGEPNNVG